MPKKRRRFGGRTAGFTLIEAAFAIIIVGLGTAALMGLFMAQTQANAFGRDLSTAVFLAEELRAMTDGVGFDQLGSFDGQVYNGVDADAQALPGLAEYVQTLVVQQVDPADLSTYVGADPQMRLLTATVSYAGEPMTQISWLRGK